MTEMSQQKKAAWTPQFFWSTPWKEVDFYGKRPRWQTEV